MLSTTPILARCIALTEAEQRALHGPARQRAQLPEIRAALASAWAARRRELATHYRSASEAAAGLPGLAESFDRANRQGRPR